MKIVVWATSADTRPEESIRIRSELAVLNVMLSQHFDQTD